MNRISINGVVYESESSMSMINNKVVCSGILYVNGVKQGDENTKEEAKVTKTYNLDGIKSVYNAAFKVKLDINPQHETEDVTITATESAHKNISSNFSRSNLMLDGRGSVGSPDIVIKAKSLEKFVHSATNNAEIKVVGTKITIINEGVGNITAEGHVKEVNFENSGVGNIKAMDLLSDKASFENSGVGNIQLTTHKLVSGNLSGVGNVKYVADEEARVAKSGIGKVKYLGDLAFPFYDNSQPSPAVQPLKVEPEVKPVKNTANDISFNDMVDSVKKTNHIDDNVDKVKNFTENLSKKFKKLL